MAATTLCLEWARFFSRAEVCRHKNQAVETPSDASDMTRKRSGARRRSRVGDPVREASRKTSRHDEIACGLAGAQEEHGHVMQGCLHGAARHGRWRVPVDGNASGENPCDAGPGYAFKDTSTTERD